ncbi:MAG: class I SAM-dependent methyltransferase [Thermoleophilia bacterium]|nr:class I SAM-dependent methyltransferase [Thermoleophilia bacterium]
MSELSSDARRNRDAWTVTNEQYTDAQARAAWARDEIDWGVFGAPESALQVLGDVQGLDVVEIGCGTAYFSAWLARRGARPVGVDVTPAQLETARRMQREVGPEFPLVEASAEDVPLPDASFDLVVSEYGASVWVDPALWVPEAARLLRPGGRLVFLCNSPLSILCSPDDGPTEERLLRPQFGMYRLEWPGENEGVNFHLPHGHWIALLRANGFEIEALVELRAPGDATDHPYYDFVPVEWAKRWPAEDLWKARKAP